MKKIILTKILILFGFFIYSQNEYFLKTYNYFEIDLSEDIYSQNNPLFDFIKNNEIQSIEKPFKTKDVNLQHTYLLKTNANVDLKALLENGKQYSFIEYIEEVPQYELFYTPNDPLYPQQYALPLINAPLAWDIATCIGNSQVVLAITDDAVRITHEDIAPILWNNPNEIPNNGIDDDNNGFIDDVVGWDAADNDNNPAPPASATNSYFSHGTHVAGIAGGATDNAIGIASIGYGVQLMPVKIGANSSGSLVGAWAGIDYTIACGYVDVVNMSWGGGSYSVTYQNLITAGYNQGITFVAAAGNSNTSVPMYPAAYNHVISVAATNQTDTRASFSNYGSTIDVAAPGVAILSTVAGADNAYDIKQGTSMASPLVAGLCALMKCYNYGATPDMIESCLKTTAVNIDAQNPSYINQLGAGRVDAQAALQCLSTSPVVAFYAEDTLVCPNQSIQFYSQSAGVQPLTYSWSFPGGMPSTSVLQNPTVSYATTGVYSVTLTVTNAYGNDVLTKTNYITVTTPTATISGNATIVPGGVAFLRVDFTGVPPYSFTYTDGTNNFTQNNVQYSPYYIQVNPSATTTYSLVSMSNDNCNGTVSGSAEVEVSTSVSTNCSNSYQFTLNDNGDSEANAVVLTQDGGYVLVGYTNDGVFGSIDLFVSKFNSQDQLMWNKIIGTSNSEKGVSIHVVEDSNGDLLVMSGSSQYIDFANRTKNTTLIKLSASGSIIWAKNKLIPNTSDYFNGRDLIFQNGHYYLTGSQIISNGGNSDAFLMEVDANGNALWSSSFNGSYIDHSINVILHSNNNLYWGGLNRTFASGASTATIHCSNNIGNALWAKKYDIPNLADGFDGFVEADNGDILGLGRTDVNANADLYIIRVDAIGNLIWSKSLAGSDYDEGMSIKKMSGDSYIISGVTSSFGNGKQLFVTKINGQGNEIWTKIYGGQQDESVYAHPNMLAINESGGYGILVGSTQSYGGSDFDPYVIKFNLEEQDSCSTQGILWVEQTVNPIVQNISASSTSLGNFASYNMSETVNPMVIDTSCFAVCNSNSETSCTDLFQKYYDNSQDSKNISNYITSDGGYVIAGMTNSYGAGQEDIFVVKYNANNQVEWSNTYGTTSRELAGTAYIIQTTANDYLVAFESTAYSDRTDAGGLVYMRLDATGNIVWQKAIDVSGSSYLHASSILEYNNEFYLMGSSGGGAQIYTLKIDGSGNRIWMKKLRFGSIEHGMRQIVGNNGKIYGCGTTTAFGGGEKGVVYQLEPSNGNVDWVKTYDNYSGSDFYYSINKTPDNNIILTGASNGGNILTKIDYAGNIIWNKYFNQSGSEFGDEIMVSSDGSLYMAGKTNNIAGHGSYDVFVTKLDANGVEQWTKLYGGAAEEDIFHRDGFFKINDNEGYGLLSYATRSYGGNDFDITITKLSLGTDTVCNEINTVLWNESNINITPVSRTFTEGTYPAEINANLSKQTMPIAESVICEVLCNTQTNSNCSYLKSYNNYNTVNDIVYKSATNQLYMSGGTVNGNLFMANMETDGTTNWSREYAASVGTTSFIGTILFADNNSDILTVELKNDQAIIYRIDNAGNIVWNKRMQKGIIRRPKLVNAGNNEYYMVCWYAPSGSSDNLVVYKFDGNGNVLWSYQYDYSDDQFFRVISNGAGGLAMSGVLSSNPFLLEIDPNGNIIHSKIENSSNYSLYRSIFKDGNFYYAHGSDKSGSNAKFFIEKFDANFNPIWKQSTGWISNRDVYDGEILKDAFGNLYLYTPVYVGSTIQDELLIKFDASGNILKEKTSTLNNSLLLHGTIVPAASAEELIIAYTSPYFSNGNKVGIIKTDTALSACILVDTTLAFGTVSSSMTTINFTRSNITLNVFNDVPTVNTLTVLTEIECEVNCDTPINPVVECNNSSIDTLICLGDSLQIDLGAVSNISWTPNYNISDVNSSNPIFWPETDTTYIVYYEDSVCQYFDTLHIQISSLEVDASYSDTTVCPNTNVQLNATGAVSYIWMPSTNLNNANIANPIFNGNTTDTLIVIGQNSNGCEASDTVIINVLPCCGAFADFDISDSIICVNETVTFTNTSIEGTNPTFTWNFGTGASPATYVGQNPPAVTYTIPGMYQVQLILSDDCGQDTVLKNIYVNDIPLLNLAPDTNICGNDSVHYQLGDIGISDYTYIWTPTNGLDNPNIANPIASINYSETYTVVVTDNFTGCVNTDSVTIHFVYEPDSIIKYSATSICANDSVQLYVDAPNDSLIWSNGSQFDTLNFVLLQDTQITVRLFIEDCIFYDTLNIEVDTIPNVNLVFNDTVCINSWDTIHVQTTGIPVWESGDTATAYPVFIEQDTILYLTTYNGLCGIEDTIYIYTRDLPEDSITGVDTVCINSTESYSVAGAYNYLWSNGSTSNSATYTILSDTIIYVTYEDAYCQNTDSFNVFVVDTPQIVIIGDTNYCDGDVVNLMVNTTDSVYWNNGTVGNTYIGNATTLDNTIVVYQFNDYCGMVSDSVMLTIDTIPNVDLVFNDTVCINSWDTINVQTTGIPVWASGDTTIAYPVFIEQDTILYLTTYNGLCGTEDTIQIYARDLPEDSITGVDTVCINSTESYSVAGAYNYLWSNGGTSNSATYTILSDTIIYVTYEDAYCQNTDSFNVFVIDTPQIVIIGDTNYCDGDVVNLMVNTTDSIYWNNGTIGNTYIGNATTLDNTIVVYQFNDYCGIVSDSVMLNIDTIPARLFTYTDTVCQFENDTITISSTGITTTLNNDTVTQIYFAVNNDTSVILQTYNGYCSVYDTINIYARSLPNLSIVGNDTTCINTVEMYSLPTGYTYLWSNGATTNSTQYAIANDTSIIVNYEDQYCSNYDSLFVVAIDTPNATIIGDTIYCEGDIYNLNIATNDSVWWSVGSNENPLADTATISETITATLYNDYCGNYTSSINLYVDTFPEIEIVSPIEMYENDEEQAEVIGNAVDWYWTPPYGLSCINCKEPIINADSSMIYILQAINNGCISYDTLVVNIKNLEDCLVIPTAFSPNGDAVNNTFKPIVLDEKTIVLSFTIYNRWGEKVHDSLSPWDGTYKGQPQNIGVYMYVVEYYCDRENKVLSGNVTLIR